MQADRNVDVDIVREAAERARRLGRPVLASWTEKTSAHDPIGFYAQAADERLLWLRPATGEALVGSGAAFTLTATGAERFKQIDAAWRELLADALLDPTPHAGPVLLGGFSFDPLRRGSPTWAGFPDARMVLPERVLSARNGATWLTTNVVVQPGEQSPFRPRPRQARAAHDPATLSPEAWQTLVARVVRGIRSGELGLQKVVLARAFHADQPEPIDTLAALRHLASSYPSCTIFALGHRNATFLGATPERLIALDRSGTAATVALAGSTSRGATPAEDQRLAAQLLGDPKERAEHAVVVDALRDGLSEVCTRVVVDAQPSVEKLANVQHLLTHVLGQVAPGRGVLDLVERLHPTPAMGGFPRQPAMELIRKHEALDRGWYAGPIGWLNAAGEGEFVVGIRSAVVRQHSATLFAGCGIVGESDPAAEFAESNWKLRPMQAALGIDP